MRQDNLTFSKVADFILSVLVGIFLGVIFSFGVTTVLRRYGNVDEHNAKQYNTIHLGETAKIHPPETSLAKVQTTHTSFEMLVGDKSLFKAVCTWENDSTAIVDSSRFRVTSKSVVVLTPCGTDTLLSNR